MANGDRESQNQTKEGRHHLARGQARALPHENDKGNEHERDDIDHSRTFNEHLPWAEKVHARTGPIHFSGPLLLLFTRQIITAPAAPPTLAAVAPKPPWF